MTFWMIVGLSVAIELVTVMLRRKGYRSPEIQARIGMPRIHHGYVGAVLLLFSFGVFSTDILPLALWVIGWALIISDIAHHYAIIPLMRFLVRDTKHYSIVSQYALLLLVIASASVVLAMGTLSLWTAVAAIGLLFISENIQRLTTKIGLRHPYIELCD